MTSIVMQIDQIKTLYTATPYCVDSNVLIYKADQTCTPS